MEQVTDRIWTETRVRGCNPSFVKTSAGPVAVTVRRAGCVVRAPKLYARPR